MNSSVIGKVEKAKLYARERERMHITQLSVDFHGENDDHKVTLKGNEWHCTCDFFPGYGTCAHTMALERVLAQMVPQTSNSVMAAHV